MIVNPFFYKKRERVRSGQERISVLEGYWRVFEDPSGI